MNSVSPAYEICVSAEPTGYTRVAYIRHAGSSVVSVDFASPRSLPNGTSELISFLNEFDEDSRIASHLVDARKEIGSAIKSAGGVSIRSLRLQRGLSQADLAAAMRTSQAAISAFENRSRKPGEDSIRELGRIFDVDFNTLMEALANG